MLSVFGFQFMENSEETDASAMVSKIEQIVQRGMVSVRNPSFSSIACWYDKLFLHCFHDISDYFWKFKFCWGGELLDYKLLVRY